MEASSPNFSSLTLIRALVICSVKARLSVLVWGSLDSLCRKPITSGKVQLSKSRSLLSTKEVVISFRLTCLKASMEVSSLMVVLGNVVENKKIRAYESRSQDHPRKIAYKV